VNNLSKSKLDGKIPMFAGMDLHKNYLQIAVMNEKADFLEEELTWVCEKSCGSVSNTCTSKMQNLCSFLPSYQ
jgi:hypothetical protein